ncbi:hypothetical protein FY036_03410 [Mesorhizobium microcysteis]|uniref:AbiTii domain-containing protein n=1 Tax=Neoaquamicrobium microcysteis TaxID=2682781 RepID=A0A5D4H1F3_9HYPH|nr:hypothetical protein [Mesorhizobium microcysteis]TYR34881.1 hypothetical protein FY036_03410 [Mesorhizobium microcysteis]
MSKLIESIQHDAIDPTVRVSTLLRKVKLAAAKLQLPEVEEWVENELNGYKGKVPPYRQIRGSPRAFNPYNGWIPIGGDPKTVKAISTASTKQSVAAIEELITSTKSGDALQQPLPPEVINALNRNAEFGGFGDMAIFVGRADVAAILDVVRNKVLDWAIALERRGITGEGMSFTAKEREEAKQVMANFTIGSIGNFIGNMGSGNTSGDINTSDVSAPQILEVTNKIKAALPELERAGVDAVLLTATIEAIEQATARESTDKGKLQGLLTDARNALVGAAGNLTADGAVAAITGLIRGLGGGA